MLSARIGTSFRTKLFRVLRRAGDADVDRLALASAPMSALRKANALSDLDDVTVRIADVAANLAVLGNRLRDELGPPTLP